jgi:hypothetical protein
MLGLLGQLCIFYAKEDGGNITKCALKPRTILMLCGKKPIIYWFKGCYID